VGVQEISSVYGILDHRHSLLLLLLWLRLLPTARVYLVGALPISFRGGYRLPPLAESLVEGRFGGKASVLT